MRLNFKTHGASENPAVLALHGFMSCNAQWQVNIDALSQHFRIITVELWGHGDSPTPTEADRYSIDAYCEQFEAIRAETGTARWALIGQSYGAGLMLHYAARFPDRCRGVVATNSRSAFGTLLADSKPGESRPPPADLRKLPYHPIHARRFPEHVKAALVAKADRMHPDAVRLGGLLGANLNCRKLVQQYPVPLLVTNGRYERSFQQDLATLKNDAPDLNIVDLEGGHSVNIEAASEFNEAVIAFLTGLPE